MEENDGGTRTILGRPLQELRDRAARLRQIVERAQGELTDAERAIKVLEKALGANAPARAARRPAEPRDMGAGASPRAAFTARVIALLRDGERTPEAIAHHFGSSQRFVEGILGNAVDRGELVVGEDGCTFGVPGGAA